MAIVFNDVKTAPSAEYVVLNGVSLTVPFRKVTGLYGKANDGQIEVLRTVAGLLPVRSGSLSVAGQDITKDKTEARNVRLIHWNQAHVGGQTVRQALKLPAQPDPSIDALLRAAGLLATAETLVADLAPDDRFLLHVVNALQTSPAALLFEESFLLYDIKLKFRLIRRLRRLLSVTSAAFVYASSDLESMRAFADTYYVFADGNVFAT